MSEDQDSQDEKGEPTARNRSDWKQMASTGTLLAAVLAILAAGAALRAEKSAPLPARETKPPAPAARPAPPPTSAAAEQSTTPPAIAEAPSRPAPAGTDLDRRAMQDVERLSRERARFTAQVAVTCKPENTRRILQRAAGTSRLYLVPMPERGDSCYRLCWGLYPSAKEAARATDLPAFLRDGGGKPAAKSVVELLP